MANERIREQLRKKGMVPATGDRKAIRDELYRQDLVPDVESMLNLDTPEKAAQREASLPIGFWDDAEVPGASPEEAEALRASVRAEQEARALAQAPLSDIGGRLFAPSGPPQSIDTPRTFAPSGPASREMPQLGQLFEPSGPAQVAGPQIGQTFAPSGSASEGQALMRKRLGGVYAELMRKGAINPDGTPGRVDPRSLSNEERLLMARIAGGGA